MCWWRGLAVLVSLVIPIVVSAQDRFFDSSGVKLHYIEHGAGEPVIMLHGRTNSVDIWTATGLLQQLSASYPVVAFDARGHGKSEKPHDPKQYGRELALDVARLMDYLRIKRAHIVGYSMGAQTVSQLLTLQPDRFLTATQFAGAGIFEWTSEQERYAEQEAVETERDCVSRTGILAGVQINETPPSDDQIEVRSAACFANPSFDRFAMAALSGSRRDRAMTATQVAAVRVPTLGVVGSLDPLADGMRALKKLRPDMKLLVVEGATHGGPGDNRGILRRPAAREALLEFLVSHRQPVSQ